MSLTSTATSVVGSTTNLDSLYPIVLLPASTAALAATYTVTPSQSGTLFRIPAQNATADRTLTITLPPVAAASGFSCTFSLIAIAGNLVRITSTANDMKSWRSVGAGVQTITGATGVAYVQFAVTAVAGDHVEIFSDGVSYMAKGFSNVAAGITSAAL
jgi:hypothetical protein